MSYTTGDRLTEAVNRNELTAGEYHRLLAVKRRRLALAALEGRDGAVELQELAREVATREGIETEDGDAFERVAVTLHHVHLPKLAEAGILEYDPEARRVEPVGE